MREHDDVRDAYAALKYKLVEEESSHTKNCLMLRGYTLGKNELIQNIIRKSGFQRVRFVICTHHAEWEAARQLRRQYFLDLNKIETIPMREYRFDPTN